MNLFFLYDQILSGKVILDEGKPIPIRLIDEYSDRFDELVNDMIEKAKKGDLESKTDALLTLSLFLEKKWKIPESLSNYISKVLRDAVIAFGHTEGKSDKRNTAICNALGLVFKQGQTINQTQVYKDHLIFQYIRLRMRLYKETKYAAAKKAVEAFKGTRLVSHDTCEKIYEKMENRQAEIELEQGSSQELNREFEKSIFIDEELLEELEHRSSFSGTIHDFYSIILYPDEFKKMNIQFQDDDFLRDLISVSPPVASKERNEVKKKLGV